jgi:hypothetical protein
LGPGGGLGALEGLLGFEGSAPFARGRLEAIEEADAPHARGWREG